MRYVFARARLYTQSSRYYRYLTTTHARKHEVTSPLDHLRPLLHTMTSTPTATPSTLTNFTSTTSAAVDTADAPTPVHLTEGSATVLYESEHHVFYNPVQQFNRDLSTLGITAWVQEYAATKKPSKRTARKHRRKAKDARADVTTDASGEKNSEAGEKSEAETEPFVTILEALSATGLRAIRYAREIPLVKTVLANDFSPSAVSSITRNIAHPSNHPSIGTVIPSHGDANSVMHGHKATSPFHVVDLDPYGTAAPFVDAAVQCVVDGGLLLVTCTDLGVLAGQGYPEKCFSNYGGHTCKTEFSHESALRLVLHLLATSAARYGKAIEPLLSLSIDFYVRLFVRVRNAPILVKQLAHNTMMTYSCAGCGATTTQRMGKQTVDEQGKIQKYHFPRGPPVGPNCELCGFVHHVGGPMWSGPLHSPAFISSILALASTADPAIYKTLPRITGMLTLASEELDGSLAPFYFTPQKLSSVMRCSSPPLVKINSALLNAGYKVSPTHAVPGAVKTNASYAVLYDVMRAWVKDHPVTEANIKPGSPARKLLDTKEPAFEVDFTEHKEANPPSRKIKITRYPQQPKFWGPLAKAKGDQAFHNSKAGGAGVASATMSAATSSAVPKRDSDADDIDASAAKKMKL
ncbi:N2,N2-dimethylguanosine tRNA methyltransferase-domain-containing protein [Limtongia smithiae]|uniref:N2,N2-dimethylguanosine tRNA methyltransferase-domain-containing protein n=1 Tax=Limtongia smithiae TaxID=1125753 RepID=UPI0034CD8E71